MNNVYKKLSLAIIILITILNFITLKAKAYVDSTQYIGPITINNSSGGSLADYQIMIDIDTSALVSAGRMNSNCSDLRITDTDQTTKLSYWIESGCNTSSTKVWIKVPSIPTSSIKTIYLSYGNSDLSSLSNGANTFIFFDDFTSLDTGIWTSTGSASASSGILNIKTGSVYSNSTLASQTGTITESRIAWSNPIAHAGLQTGNTTNVASGNATSAKVAYIMSPDGGIVGSAGDGTTASYNIYSGLPIYNPGTAVQWTATSGQYYIAGIAVTGSNVLFFKDYGLSHNPTGTWSGSYYVWLGSFRGSNAGTTNGTDIAADWVRIRKHTTTAPTITVDTGLIPSAPQNLVSYGGNTKAYLVWDTPSVTGGGITDYIIEYKEGNGSFQTFSDGTSNTTNATVTGLNNGSIYTFRISAVNSSGTGVTSSTSVSKVENSTVHGILLTGQSHSVGYSGGPALSTTQPYYNLQVNAAGTRLIPLTEITDIIGDAYNGAVESPASALGNTITAQSTNNNWQIALVNNAVPGYAYSQLKKSTSPYNTGLTNITFSKSIAVSTLDRGYKIEAVANIHGPADRTRANEYESYLNEWQNDYENDIKAITGQTGNIPMFIDQSSNFTAYSETTSDLVIAQLSAAENNSDIYMVTPKYMLNYLADYLHLENTSYRLLGEYYGKAIKRVVHDEASITALAPVEYTRNNNIVYVRFEMPQAPLAFDTSTVLSKTNYGFEFYDDSGSTPAITNVELLGQDKVKITLASEPTGATQNIRYAYTGVSGAKPGANSSGSARGNLRDSDVATGPSGTPLYNWSVHFNKSISEDNTEPTISSDNISVNNNSATITWNTNENTNAYVEYGLTTSYSANIENDTYPIDQSHSITLSSLIPCTVYNYRIKSTDLANNTKTTDNKVFKTTGCTGSATIESYQANTISRSTGGTTELLDNGKGLLLNIPTHYAASDSIFQIKKLEKDSFFNAASKPSTYNSIGSHVYDLKSLTDNSTTISSFDKNINITINYSNSDIKNIDESSLKIYHWDGSEWNETNECDVTENENKITCKTLRFSVFALMGKSSQDNIEYICNKDIPEISPWLYSASSLKNNQIKIKFTDASGNFENFELKYGIGPDAFDKTIDNIGNDKIREYILEDLKSNTEYYIKIRASNGCAKGPWSNSLGAKTKTIYNINKYYSLETNINNNDTKNKETKNVNISEKKTDNKPELISYNLTLSINDSKGNPIKDAKVTIHSNPKYGVTDENGKISFKDVEQGNHKLIIEKEGIIGEQSLNITGDKQDISISITIKQSNPFMNLKVISSIIFLIIIIVILLRIIFLRAVSKPY